MLDYAEHALTEGTDAQAASYVEGGRTAILWGVGIDTNTATASMRAILSARSPRTRAPVAHRRKPTPVHRDQGDAA